MLREEAVRPVTLPTRPPGGQASRASPRGPGPAVRVSGEAVGSRGAQMGYMVRWPLLGHRPSNDGAEIGTGPPVPKALLLPGCQTKDPFTYLICSGGRSSFHDL